MAEKPRYTIAVTTNRYELEWEAETLAALDDMERETLRVLRGQRPRTVANPRVLERVALAPYA